MISLATSIVHPVISAFNNAVTSSSKHYVTLPLNLLSFRCLQSYQVFSYAQIYHFFSAARSRKKTTSAETGNYTADCPNKMYCYYRRTRSVSNPESTYLWSDQGNINKKKACALGGPPPPPPPPKKKHSQLSAIKVGIDYPVPYVRHRQFCSRH